MSYSAGRRRRVIPIPNELPFVPQSPFVPPVRQPPGTPWTPANVALPIAFPQPTQPHPQRYPMWSTPARPTFQLPGHTPVWPPTPMHLPYTPAVPSPPQQLPMFWEPGTFPALPFGTPAPLRLHPHLIFNPNNPMIPVLQWDILHRAEQARVFTGRQLIVPLDLNAQAILPDVSKIYITSDHPVLQAWMESWGPIMVENSSIKIRDILDAIYDYFQQPLTRREYRSIRGSPENHANLVYAAHRRAGDAHELYPIQLAGGFKRVDAIGGHRRFQGLRPVVFQDNTWKLFLGLLPGPVPQVA